MRKLYLMMDNWIENKPFVQSEIEEIRKYYDVSIICNDSHELKSEDFPGGLKYYKYAKKNGIRVLLHVLKFITDKSAWNEINTIRKSKATNKKNQILEVLKFYINAELYFDFIKKNNLIEKESDTIYYSYWYFWKCFAITKHRNDYKNIKIITRAHGYDLYKEQNPSGYQPFKKAMDDSLDRVIFISEHGLKYYEEELGIGPSEKHCLCKLGTKDVEAIYIDEERIIEALDTPNRIIRIVSCSSLVELKRVHLIVEALSKIDDINIEWTHFGSGPLYEDIKDLATTLLKGKKNIIYSLPGQVSNKEIIDYYEHNFVDIFMMMSRSEGNPVSVIEAMSCGIPIISTNINNMPNLIKGNGILIGDNPTSVEVSIAIRSIANLSLDENYEMRSKSRKIWKSDYKASANNKFFVEEILLRL